MSVGATLRSPRGIIWAMLAAQMGIGAALLMIDLSAPPPAGPARLFAPSTTGPETRPYRPDVGPAPGRDGPAMRSMPALLEFTTEGDVLQVVGQIAPGDAERLAAFLDERGPAALPLRLVRLDSSGGVVAEALRIGRSIRAMGLATEVAADAVCFSACPYMLAGGTQREVAEGGIVGVHQHYFGENTLLPAFMAVEDVQRGQAEVMRYLDEMGVDPLLMLRALETPASEIFVLDAGMMDEVRLTTG